MKKVGQWGQVGSVSFREIPGGGGGGGGGGRGADQKRFGEDNDKGGGTNCSRGETIIPLHPPHKYKAIVHCLYFA